MMKIIFSDSSDLKAQHARDLLARYEKNQHFPPPRVASVHAAITPRICDDCGLSYWERFDSWGPHYGCKGEPKTPVKGFG